MQRKMLIVRRLLEADIDAVVALERTIFSDPWSEKSIRETYKEERALILVAEQHDDIVGYCIAYSVLDEVEIARIAVNSSLRRQGIGHELLEHLAKICKEKGISHLMLEVREGNDKARAFYHAYGFGVDGIRKNYYQSPVENAVLMSMVLPTVPTIN